LLNAEQLDVTEYGRKYAVTGSITGPNGRAAEIVSVWITGRRGNAALCYGIPKGLANEL
jgi:hypothetical protein